MGEEFVLSESFLMIFWKLPFGLKAIFFSKKKISVCMTGLIESDFCYYTQQFCRCWIPFISEQNKSNYTSICKGSFVRQRLEQAEGYDLL